MIAVHHLHAMAGFSIASGIQDQAPEAIRFSTIHKENLHMTSKKLPLTLMALAVGSAGPAMAQTSGISPENQALSSQRLRQVLHLPSTAGVVKPNSKAPVSDAVARGLAKAKVYRFASADYPGAPASFVLGENTSTVLGNFEASYGGIFGFTLRSGIYRTLTVEGALAGPEALAINAGGDIVGLYEDFSHSAHGFIDRSGAITNIDEPDGQPTTPYGLSVSGQIVGTHGSHSFTTSDYGASYTDFDVPNSTLTAAYGVNSSGVIVGEWNDAQNAVHGYMRSGNTFTELDFPLATSTTAYSINDSNEVAGFYFDTAGVEHGFIYSAGEYQTVDVAGAVATAVSHITNSGQVTGVYLDSNNEPHGFTTK